MFDNEINDTRDPLADIAPHGDVVLLIGPDKACLRVWSQCLRTASTVFDVMFGPYWSEGRGLSSNAPPEIALPEDNPDALRTIFCVLHHRTADIPATLEPNKILDIAVASDKYDLAAALKLAIAQWMDVGNPDELPSLYTVKELMAVGQLMTAAFLFGDASLFTRHTTQLILGWGGSYYALLNNEVTGQFLAIKAIYLLSERRNRVRLELNAIIATGLQKTNVLCPSKANHIVNGFSIHGIPDCIWEVKHRKCYGKYAKLRKRFLQGLEYRPSDMILFCLKTHKFEVHLSKFYVCEFSDDLAHESLASEERLSVKLDGIKHGASICIHCVREKREFCSEHGGTLE